MSGLGAVVTKEAVKLGFKSVTMMDHLLWTDEDRTAQFLIPPELTEPRNRAEASLERAQTLNSSVEVQAEAVDFKVLEDDFFEGRFDAIVAADLPLQDILKLNDICRRSKIKFFATNIFGSFGFFFLDLLDKHSFKKPVRGINSPYGGKVENFVPKCLEYVPLKKVIDFEFQLRDFLTISPWYYVLRGHLKYNSQFKNRPTKSPEGVEKLKSVVDEEIALSFGRDPTKVPTSFIEMSLGPTVPAVAQIVGSMLKQEIVKAVTLQGEPVHNLYFFDPSKNKGITTTVL